MVLAALGGPRASQDLEREEEEQKGGGGEEMTREVLSAVTQLQAEESRRL